MTISDAVAWVLAIAFIIICIRRIWKCAIEVYEKQKDREEQMKKTWEAVSKYPEYRMQSVHIQEVLESEIQEIREMQRKNTKSLADLEERISRNEEQSKRRDRNKLRDILLQNYRHYTCTKTNPTQTWTHMEAETFWELFHDYEDMDGNGYIHSDVLPRMEQLQIVDSKPNVVCTE